MDLFAAASLGGWSYCDDPDPKDTDRTVQRWENNKTGLRQCPGRKRALETGHVTRLSSHLVPVLYV